MTSARRLYLLHLGLASVAVAAVLAAGLAALTRIEPAIPSAGALLAACQGILPTQPGLGALVLSLMLLGLAVVVMGTRSLGRQLWRQRSFIRQLPPSDVIDVDGRDVVLLQSPASEAFCAGFVRPRIYLSTSALERLTDVELRAVVAHEEHHRRNRDPLRLLLATVTADALFFVPALRRLSERYGELAELAADEAAGKAEGSAALASALLSFGERDGQAAPIARIAAERVDHLLGDPPRWRLPMSIFASSLLILFTLLAAALTSRELIASDSFSGAALVAEACVIGMFAVPLAIGTALVLRWRRQHLHSPARA